MSAEATVLYDAPGPRARIRNAVIAAAFLAVIAVVSAWVIMRLGDRGQLTGDMWRPFITASTWTVYILPGLWGTIKAAVVSIVAALVLGAFLGIGRLSEHRAVRLFCGAFTEGFRAIPVLLLILFTYYFYAQYGIVPPSQLAFAAVVTGLTLYNGTVIAEILRSGINSLPRGQSEAGTALGLRKSQLMRMVLLPQAVTAMLPALVSQMVIALKDSALGYIIGYVEVVRSGIMSASFYGNYIPALIVVALVMIAINFSLSAFATWLEKRMRSGRGKRGKVEAVDLEEAVAP
ncbi:glutamate ABC transporter permease protein [Gordonia araii NBRC 100433]|uniref:Glutamate ABC transporter permease protein n=1 Tax=Gordonia araii NBRC 100433 TaxID=1073574 RepID=G7H0E6_9ACTN|nr:amino acid ABC transporter permease [Gordonia araii]NNG96915.1 amino acid ABC transporter permease [Gordonia araii NBRC 100433]GAB09321.1 glutamate ABC transporter permease protein [Gordonia araii NBRC 100433]